MAPCVRRSCRAVGLASLVALWTGGSPAWASLADLLKEPQFNHLGLAPIAPALAATVAARAGAMGASERWLNCGSLSTSARLAHAGEPPVQTATSMTSPTAREPRRTHGAGIRALARPAKGPIARGMFMLRLLRRRQEQQSSTTGSPYASLTIS